MILKYFSIISGVILALSACKKVDYTRIERPAYLRVFNDLNYVFNMGEKDGRVPFLCMLVNPVLDADGKPTGGEITGDFLDVRDPYAPPYPSHIGSSTSVNNPEYPGKENVLVGPILNGYDLSSWAQVPSGKLRFMFLYRPKNTVPYFQLEKKLQGDVMLDTTLELTGSEVYTLHLLQKDFAATQKQALLRRESFHKQPFSDSLVYVNFYNYSADGFWQSDDKLKPRNNRMGRFQYGIKDQMDVFLTLYRNQSDAIVSNYYGKAVAGYKGKYLTTLIRNNSSSAVNPYLSFPLWADPTDDGIRTESWQYFDFFTPGITPATNPYGRSDVGTGCNWTTLCCLKNGSEKPYDSRDFAVLPNMLVSIHSGVYNPRSFATVNTIEVVNGSVYLTTIQRKYPAPVY